MIIHWKGNHCFYYTCDWASRQGEIIMWIADPATETADSRKSTEGWEKKSVMLLVH